MENLSHATKRLIAFTLEGEFEELRLSWSSARVLVAFERVSWELRHVIGAKTRRMCRVFPRPRNRTVR